MDEVQAWTPPEQCRNCVHRRLTGGIVLDPEWTCSALEGEPGKVARVMTLILMSSAARNECLVKEALPTPEGSYLSADLLRHQPQPNPTANPDD